MKPLKGDRFPKMRLIKEAISTVSPNNGINAIQLSDNSLP